MDLLALLLGLFAAGHCAGVLLAAGSLERVQRWLDARGRGRNWGSSVCGLLLLTGAGFLIASAQ
jgi:cytochrome c-type biogenesis protein